MFPLLSPWLRTMATTTPMLASPLQRHQQFTQRLVQRYLASEPAANEPVSNQPRSAPAVQTALGTHHDTLRSSAPFPERAEDSEAAWSLPTATKETVAKETVAEATLSGVSPSEPVAHSSLSTAEVGPEESNDHPPLAQITATADKSILRTPGQLSQALRETLRRRPLPTAGDLPEHVSASTKIADPADAPATATTFRGNLASADVHSDELDTGAVSRGADNDANTTAAHISASAPLPQDLRATRQATVQRTATASLPALAQPTAAQQGTAEQRATPEPGSTAETSATATSMVAEIERRIQRTAQQHLTGHDSAMGAVTAESATSTTDRPISPRPEQSTAMATTTSTDATTRKAPASGNDNRDDNDDTAPASLVDEIERRIQHASQQQLQANEVNQPASETAAASASHRPDPAITSVPPPVRRKGNARIYSQVEEIKRSSAAPISTRSATDTAQPRSRQPQAAEDLAMPLDTTDEDELAAQIFPTAVEAHPTWSSIAAEGPPLPLPATALAVRTIAETPSVAASAGEQPVMRSETNSPVVHNRSSAAEVTESTKHDNVEFVANSHSPTDSTEQQGVSLAAATGMVAPARDVPNHDVPAIAKPATTASATLPVAVANEQVATQSGVNRQQSAASDDLRDEWAASQTPTPWQHSKVRTRSEPPATHLQRSLTETSPDPTAFPAPGDQSLVAAKEVVSSMTGAKPTEEASPEVAVDHEVYEFAAPPGAEATTPDRATVATTTVATSNERQIEAQHNVFEINPLLTASTQPAQRAKQVVSAPDDNATVLTASPSLAAAESKIQRTLAGNDRLYSAMSRLRQQPQASMAANVPEITSLTMQPIQSQLSRAKPPAPDLDALARQVLPIIKRILTVERERE